MGRRVGRNESCPCGTGRKYKDCCWNKRFEFHREDDGSIVRMVPLKDLHPEEQRLLEDQVQKATEHFKGKSGPRPLFFDVDFAKVEDDILKAMRTARIHPRFIYAWRKTGILYVVGEEDAHSEQSLADWDAACAEWDALHGGIPRH